MKSMDHRDNFIYLTFALILLLLGTALAQQFFAPTMQRLMQSTTVITLLVAVWGIESKQFILRKTFIFPLAILAVALFSNWLDNAGFDQFYLVYYSAFLFLPLLKPLNKCYLPV